jgi:hypothetical protein
MFVPAPIDDSDVLYTMRPKLKRNAGFFVDGTAGRGRGMPRVVPQQAPCIRPPVQNCDPYGSTNGRCCGTNGAGTCDGAICWPPGHLPSW